jgi:hypothetical protein
VFLLYAVLVGLALGLLLGGRPSGLARFEFRWAPLVALGMAIQLALFAGPIAERVGAGGPLVYVGSSVLVLAAVARNWRTTGMPLVALGAFSNLAAILLNGGYMPASTAALAAQARVPSAVYSNSSAVSDPVLAPLTDVFAMPTWLPMANVFSVGDVLIGLGIALTIVAAMRHREEAPARAETAAIHAGAPGN